LVSFYPFVILLSSVFLADLKLTKISKLDKKSKTLATIIAILIITNLTVSSRIFLYAENRNQDEQLQDLADRFSQSDIVVLPDNYYEKLGRFAAVLKYHYGLDTVWSAFDEKKSSYVDLSAISQYLSQNEQRNIFVISAVGQNDDKDINILFDNEDLIQFENYIFKSENMFISRDRLDLPPSAPIVSTNDYYIYQYQSS